jgi:hypothetical protein
MIRYGKIVWLGGLVLVVLLACSSQDDQRAITQSYFFLESLKQVDAGGRQLQNPALDETGINQALNTLDEGLKLAFQVERGFLDELDLRLGKNYERFFIKGVENYRLGIEAGDEQQQLDGLRLLQQWADFWSEVRAGVQEKLPSA